jgi:hypothetical protein
MGCGSCFWYEIGFMMMTGDANGKEFVDMFITYKAQQVNQQYKLAPHFAAATGGFFLSPPGDDCLIPSLRHSSASSNRACHPLSCGEEDQSLPHATEFSEREGWCEAASHIFTTSLEPRYTNKRSRITWRTSGDR